MWHCQAQLASKMHVLSLLFKRLYLGMCELWPFLSCYVDTCVSVLWCLKPFLLSPCTPVHIHWHCDWQVISSTWHMCSILVWLACSGSFSLCPMLCSAPYYRPEVSVSRQQRSWLVVRWWHPLFSFSHASLRWKEQVYQMV